MVSGLHPGEKQRKIKRLRILHEVNPGAPLRAKLRTDRKKPLHVNALHGFRRKSRQSLFQWEQYDVSLQKSLSRSQKLTTCVPGQAAESAAAQSRPRNQQVLSFSLTSKPGSTPSTVLTSRNAAFNPNKPNGRPARVTASPVWATMPEVPAHAIPSRMPLHGSPKALAAT